MKLNFDKNENSINVRIVDHGKEENFNYVKLIDYLYEKNDLEISAFSDGIAEEEQKILADMIDKIKAAVENYRSDEEPIEEEI